MRIAHDNIRFSEAGNDPALKHLAGRTGGTASFFAERTAHREQVVTGHDNWNFANPLCINCIRMVADVNDGRPPRRDFFSELSPKENKLVDIPEPLRYETARRAKVSQERSRLDQLRGSARGGQAIEHHRGEPLHAWLSIERIITDQKNHRSCAARPKNGAAARRSGNVGLSGEAASAPTVLHLTPQALCSSKPDKGRRRKRQTQDLSADQTGRSKARRSRRQKA